MNLVFMNSLELKVGENRVKTSQVSICENQGRWFVLWNEPNQDGKLVQQEWYEGDRWDEMIAVFRERLNEKMSEGYHPIVSGIIDPTATSTGKARMNQMMNYYGELNGQEELYQLLRKWRRDESVKQGKAPYIIASNRLLKMICAFIPHSKEELLQIPGVGENKVRVHGDAILELTLAFERTTSFPLDWVSGTIDEQQFQLWQIKQKEMKIKTELDKQASKKKLLEGISRGDSLSIMHEQLNMPRRDILLWVEELFEEGYDLTAFIENELESVAVEEKELAWRAFEEEGDRYLKPVLKKLYTDDDMKGKSLDPVYEWLRLLRLQFRIAKGAMASKAS